MTCRSDFTILLSIRSSNINLFRPFSASLVPLELFFDCFGNAVFVFPLLKATVPSEAEEKPIFFNCSRQPRLFSTRTRVLSRAALRVFRVGNLLACIFKSILRAVKKPFRASLKQQEASVSIHQCKVSSYVWCAYEFQTYPQSEDLYLWVTGCPNSGHKCSLPGGTPHTKRIGVLVISFRG